MPSATWETVKTVRAYTGLPVVCKGILIVEGIHRAAEAGTDAIKASNRRGRAVGRCGAWQALELQGATGLVGCVPKGAVREPRATGGNRGVGASVRNRGVDHLYRPL
ncbi:alpha-hydroxy-acid oxidizing protein [Kibdelosporangium aridum]|uniref:alpha-hydroxy-acid oxidizing protein n=1 Tax=Kibdelosporangium aridum TaxID=2030 RepID=UPI0035EDB075